jgi:hypothetical protein
MLTEDLKREIEMLDKIAGEWHLFWNYIKVNDNKFAFYCLDELTRYPRKVITEFSTDDFSTGINRLMREIKAYLVVG